MVENIKMQGGRDYRIENLRTLATMGIAIFHFEWIYVGHPVFFEHFYLFVEFFFVLSGFFLCKNEKEYSHEDTYASIHYVWKELKKLWPPYIVAFVFSTVVYCKVNGICGRHSVFKTIWNAKWEMCFLQLAGFDPNAPVINGVTAYIPALIIASLIIFFLLHNHFKLTINVLSFLVPIAIYSHILNQYGNLSQWLPYEGWYSVGILRGMAGMLIGVFAYEIGGIVLKKQKWGWIVEILSYIAIVSLVMCRKEVSFYDEVLYPYLFAALISSIYFRNPILKLSNAIKKICVNLGGLSYYIFLIHYGICFLLKMYFPERDIMVMSLIYMVVIFGGSIVFRLGFDILHFIMGKMRENG